MSERMTPEQFGGACIATRTLLESHLGRAIAAGRDEANPCSLRHLSWMLARATCFYIEERKEKANRWLGYVQGVMAARDLATLEELKRANMPPGEAYDASKV